MNTAAKYPSLSSEAELQAFVEAGGKIIGVDVDTQGDFVKEGGALYVPAPKVVRQNIEDLTNGLRNRIGSVDSHAYDAWEFSENGGPFNRHCVKGTEGWLKIPETLCDKVRFVPMSEGGLVVGESKFGEGNREYGSEQFATEVIDGEVATYFEKEVYSMFANPNAEPFIEAMVEKLKEEEGLSTDQILFAVYGYCTGGYCVDAAALGLRERGYNTAIISDAVAPLNISQTGEQQDGVAVTRQTALDNNIHMVTTSTITNLI